mmetsp:Transcript_19703/g.32519  ORF Transcript_19703/g.32519 Transcript_19703/m.32519 type:complete len:291 (+) Transcript_19703:107-979(+)
MYYAARGEMRTLIGSEENTGDGKMLTLGTPLGAQNNYKGDGGFHTMLRKTEREKELWILTRSIVGWLSQATEMDVFAREKIDADTENYPSTDGLDERLFEEEERILWQELRRGDVMQKVLLKADKSLLPLLTAKDMKKTKNSTFHSFENLQNILNAAKSLGVGIKADVSAEDFFSKTRRREALFFLSDLIDAAYQRSKEKGDSQLPPPPLTAANEKIETVMSRGNAALDQTSTYPALQNVLKQSNVDSKVSSILKSFSDILCQKVCDGFYLLDGNVPIYVAVMEVYLIIQ